jgi:hypothetical protein
MKKKYYFTQISAPVIASLTGYVAVKLLKLFLGDWFQADNSVHVLFFGTTIVVVSLGGVSIWGKILSLIGILSKKEAKGYPFSKPWEADRMG